MSSLSEARDDHMCQIPDPASHTDHTHQIPDPASHNDYMRQIPDPASHDAHTHQTPDLNDPHVDRSLAEPVATDPWHATPTLSDSNDQYKTEADEMPQFEVFVDVQLKRSWCCACCVPRRHTSAPRIRERTVEGGGLSNVGDNLRQVDPLRNAGQNVEGMRTVGDNMRRVGPFRSAGQGLSRAGPLRSAGSGLRSMVGLGKPRRPEDGFTAEEEREFLLKCDQLEREEDN